MLRDLDRKIVTLYGFVLPLSTTTKQKHFCSPLPTHCPFCVSQGPDSLIEVMARVPVEFSAYDPVVVTGKLELINDSSFLPPRRGRAGETLMATAPAKPPLRPVTTPGNATGAHAKPAMSSSGTFTAEQLSPDSTAFPPLYEAALLYSADCYDAAELVLKENLRTKEGKDSLRVWLMLFDLYQLTNNRKEFDALSMLFTVKFERSPPVWTSARRRPIRAARKNASARIFPRSVRHRMADCFRDRQVRSVRQGNGSCRIGFEKVKSIHNEEAELFSLVFARLRRMKIPMWFNGFADFAALLKKSINDLSGQPVSSSQGYWSLLFELYILDGKHEE